MNKLFTILLGAEFVCALFVFVLLFYISAPYGRFLRPGWGFTIPAKWAWIIQELPAFMTPLMMFVIYKGWESPVSTTMLLIWETHYLHRTFIYPFRFGSGKKPYPVLIVLFAVIFNCMNGFINGYFLFSLSEYTVNWWVDFRFLFGLAFFIIGFLINKSADSHLRQLKQQNSGYQIPTKGLFRWISSPHYFGEWVEWTGWAILTWSLPGLAFAAFTFANLAPRAWSHHTWYRETFENYPKKRKSFIPFLW